MTDNKQFKLALVTGATSGIGESLCRLLASKGINLLITGRNTERLDELTTELSKQVKVTKFTADLSAPDQRHWVLEQIHTHVPDLIINNAGFGLYGPALSHPTAEQLKILNVDGLALLEITLEAARTLRAHAKTGTILNVASAAAFFAFPELAVYSAVKSFVLQLSQSLDAELQSAGIRVLATCPGMVDTEFSKRAGGEKDSSALAMSISPDKAAHCIWHQIQTEKPVYIFDWRTRWGTYLSRILPQCLVTAFLRARIAQRRK